MQRVPVESSGQRIKRLDAIWPEALCTFCHAFPGMILVVSICKSELIVIQIPSLGLQWSWHKEPPAIKQKLVCIHTVSPHSYYQDTIHWPSRQDNLLSRGTFAFISLSLAVPMYYRQHSFYSVLIAPTYHFQIRL